MKTVITIIQIVVSIALAALILLQAQGAGLGSAFGGSGGSYRSKRGLEKFLFRFTIIIAVLFFISSILNFAIS